MRILEAVCIVFVLLVATTSMMLISTLEHRYPHHIITANRALAWYLLTQSELDAQRLKETLPELRRLVVDGEIVVNGSAPMMYPYVLIWFGEDGEHVVELWIGP